MSIDSCYLDVLKQLTETGRIIEISNHLNSLKNNEQRTLYVYNIIKGLKAFPKIVDVKKCQNVSIHYRNLGNQCFYKMQNFEAWQYYNLALLHAPIDTENYNIALSNRSAVFSTLKMYDECVNDIKHVLSRGCVEDSLVQKLTKREALCKQALSKQGAKVTENNDEIDNIIILKGPRHERYVCASPKVDVVYSEDMGRHIIAKEDIKVGEILAQETPYLTVLLKSQFLFCCTYCLSRSPNLYPCDNCCMSLYCSKECKEKAFKEYHEIECPLLAYLVHMDFTKLELIALRVVIKARTDHESWSSFLRTIKAVDALDKTEFQGHVKVNGKWVYDSKYYESIHTLASNVEKRSPSDIFQKAVTAAMFLRFLSDKTNFLNVSDDENKVKVRSFVAGLLLHHCMTSPTNMHGISSNIENEDGHYLMETSIASGCYGFLSLLNHSCSPNVVRFSKLGTGEMSLFALRPIGKGMQLFDNYGSHHALEDLYTRQKALKFQYKFDCLCEACFENWPTYLTMSPAQSMIPNLRRRKQKLLDVKVFEKLQKGDRETARKFFKPLCDFAEDLDTLAPCIELADCQEFLKQCLIIFEGLVPYGYSKLVEWNAIPPKC